MRPSRNRPGFIVVSLIVLISMLLGACAQPTPAPAPAATSRRLLLPHRPPPQRLPTTKAPEPTKAAEPTKAPAAAPAATKRPEPTKA